MDELDEKSVRLISLIQSYGRCAVAFSAGVDSTVVAKAAQLALGDQATAVTANSPSLASGELEEACRLARLIGIRHRVVETQELQNPAYAANHFDRCYHCKTELYGQLDQLGEDLGFGVILNGANLDDLGDHRPGLRAARESNVQSPLAECGFGKQLVRELARKWQLPVWNKPAAPCLSSRIAYGEEVTPERLRMIDRAEQLLHELGLVVVRVRYHKGEVARLEVPLDDLPRLICAPLRQQLVAGFRELGFKFVGLDLAGFESGSLNSLVPIDQLERTAVSKSPSSSA